MSRLLRVLVPLSLLAATVTATPAAAAAVAARPAPEFTTTTTARTVASRTDRRPMAGAVHDPVAGATYITWSGQHADNYVQAYDHRRGTWSPPQKIAAGESDPHNYPTVLLADDGHVLVFQGVHNKALVMTRSNRAHSVADGWTQTEIAQGEAASYPMPFKTANGDIYVFFRETTQELDPSVPTDTRPMRYVVSTDDGRTWRNSEQLTGKPFAIGSTARADNMNEIYIGQMRYERLGGRERVHIVYTLAGGGPEGHKHDRYHRNVYYAWFDPATRTFHSAGGRDLGPQIDDADQEQHLKVAETPLVLPGGMKSPDYIQLVGANGNRPFLLWFTGDDDKVLHDFASVWTGNRWETSEIATGLRLREAERVDGSAWRVYATREGKPGIETFLLAEGRRWQAETVIPTAKPVQRVEVVTGFRDPARIIATGASSDRDVKVADGDITVAGIRACRVQLPVLGCVLR
ncbi:BNR-4 repeat-containing protein [Allokutzneria albata]|uniref:BNR repeat-containing family member n=1 Tax=Allokutzneria albata TaxID=211114 RepID=A0A1H0ADB9_ALLAB|nr:BNR-4 repeat-containing protein [Allokutzneria albata]SDN31622.1 BNR repeat-containing family member [Allokutzneria albata]